MREADTGRFDSRNLWAPCRQARLQSDRDRLERPFNALLSAHGPALAGLVGSYVQDPAERGDLCQEIAIAVWRALPGFRHECSERTFVFRIAHNRCLTQVSRTPANVDVDHDGDLVTDPRPAADAQLAGDQRRERLMLAIRALPPGYRQVVTLILEGLSYREVAEVVGISESNVGARLSRARQLLRDRMER